METILRAIRALLQNESDVLRYDTTYKILIGFLSQRSLLLKEFLCENHT